MAFPEKKRLFKRVKADELAAYGAQLMTRKQSKENSGRLYPVQGRSGKVVELSDGNFYPLIEKDEEQGCYVLDGQEFSKVSMDRGTVRNTGQRMVRGSSILPRTSPSMFMMLHPLMPRELAPSEAVAMRFLSAIRC